MFGFLGPNGAGKTTAMKMIQCVSPKNKGKLEVFGMDVSTDQRKIKRLLGVLPQENNLDPDFTVYQNLLVYSRYFDIPQKKAQKSIEEPTVEKTLLERTGHRQSIIIYVQ